jgi:hypothetical protein
MNEVSNNNKETRQEASGFTISKLCCTFSTVLFHSSFPLSPCRFQTETVVSSFSPVHRTTTIGTKASIVSPQINSLLLVKPLFLAIHGGIQTTHIVARVLPVELHDLLCKTVLQSKYIRDEIKNRLKFAQMVCIRLNVDINLSSAPCMSRPTPPPLIHRHNIWRSIRIMKILSMLCSFLRVMSPLSRWSFS